MSKKILGTTSELDTVGEKKGGERRQRSPTRYVRMPRSDPSTGTSRGKQGGYLLGPKGGSGKNFKGMKDRESCPETPGTSRFDRGTAKNRRFGTSFQPRSIEEMEKKGSS